jgi:hypothetical protein
MDSAAFYRRVAIISYAPPPVFKYMFKPDITLYIPCTWREKGWEAGPAGQFFDSLYVSRLWYGSKHVRFSNYKN